MKDLIARLESATEGSEKLDEHIYFNVHPKIVPDEYPLYTTSLDAALTLARNKREINDMLYAASDKSFNMAMRDGGNSEPDLWPCIKAALMKALEARSA